MLKILQIIFCLLLPLFINAAERVVSLSPAVTELVIFAGGRAQLCARSSACTMPEVKHLPIAGDLGKPFPEAVLRHRAALIISDIVHPQANWQVLQRCGIKIELLNNRSIDDLTRNVRRIGKLLALPGSEAAAAGLSGQIAELKRRRPSRLRPAVVLFGVSPLISCGDDTFIAAALDLAGVENLAAPAGKKYFVLTPEFLCTVRPELLIFIGVTGAQAEKMLEKSSFRHLRRCRRIFLAPDIWGRLTPGMIPAVAELQRQLAAE